MYNLKKYDFRLFIEDVIILALIDIVKKKVPVVQSFSLWHANFQAIITVSKSRVLKRNTLHLSF